MRFLFSLEQPATFYIFCTQICKPSKILIKNNLGFIQAIELVSAIWEMHAKWVPQLSLHLLTGELLSFPLYNTMPVERGAKVSEIATAWAVR